MSDPLSPGMEESAMQVVMRERRPVLAEPYLIHYPDDVEGKENDIAEAEWLSQYLPQAESIEEVMQPISDLFYPILEDAHEKIEWVDENFSAEDHRVAGFFSVSIFWKDTLKNILPEGSDGMHVSDTRKRHYLMAFPFQHMGSSVLIRTSLLRRSPGDFHDPQYDDMALNSLIYDLRSFSDADGTSYSGLPLDDSFCPQSVTVYPSQTKEDAHTSNTPMVFALLTACVFIFTVLAFIVYNCVVERRQKIVYKSAMVSNALVSSLFPEQVKKQLMATQEAQENGVFPNNGLSKHKLQNFLDDPESNDTSVDAVAVQNANQIAELFPETTVLFADIAGFTA
ncbi:MAG: hypothetical protein SGARI_001300, partial [Bacillariaceae sp.]